MLDRPVTAEDVASAAVAWRTARGRPAQSFGEVAGSKVRFAPTLDGGVMILTFAGTLIFEASPHGQVRYADRGYAPADLIQLFTEPKEDRAL